MEHRKLLPRPDSDVRDPPGSSNTSSSLAGLTPKRKKAPGRFACDACRSRKSACDGQRPICSTCRTRRAECLYKGRDKPRGDESSSELLNMLKTLTEAESRELLHKLRETSEGYTLLPTPAESTRLYSHASTPEHSSLPYFDSTLVTKAAGIELELMVRYPIAYPCLCALDLDTSLYDASVRLSAGPPQIGQDGPSVTDASHDGTSPAYCDVRLSQVDFRIWTDVHIDDGLAAGALSYYLETDHPIHGLFDADLFLGDLSSGELNFCSPMLVNAILAWCCQAYGAVEVAAADYKTAFFDESTRRWEAEEHRNTLTSVAAAHLLSMTATGHGKDDVADHYLQEAIAMGHRMGLYGTVEAGSAKTWLDNHHSWIRAASHTAWGGYCSATHHSLHYQTPLVEHPPLLPIPGELGSVLARSKGDKFLSYPMPLYAGQTFNKLCELFQIAHKALWVYYDGEGNEDHTPIQRVSLPFAEQLYRELLDWSASLPLDLVRTDATPHHAIILHTYFHCLVLDIFRPFIDNSKTLPLDTFETGQHPGSVYVVYRASVDQLKRLVLFYLTKFPAVNTSALWRPALIYVLNSLIRDARLSSSSARSPQWNVYFRACMFGLSKQLPCFHITDKIVRGILSMAVRDRVMDRDEAIRELDEMRRKAGTEGQGDDSVDISANGGKGSFIVDLDLAARNPPAATVDALVDQFDNLAMLADVTSLVIDGES